MLCISFIQFVSFSVPTHLQILTNGHKLSNITNTHVATDVVNIILSEHAPLIIIFCIKYNVAKYVKYLINFFILWFINK